ncbi:Calcium uptake protein 3, mitochondrial [Bulinus truncatus]|nr:Calcium uptake protein 3, mitochondrial [Bulinus truncatus]
MGKGLADYQLRCCWSLSSSVGCKEKSECITSGELFCSEVTGEQRRWCGCVLLGIGQRFWSCDVRLLSVVRSTSGNSGPVNMSSGGHKNPCPSEVRPSHVLSNAYQLRKRKENTIFAAKNNPAEEESNAKCESTSYREMRFRHFASVEYDGNIYMTPQDFLESLTEESPRARIGRTVLNRSEVDSLLKYTPPLSKGSDKLFRKLHDKGIISYTEYLFLLCVLTMSSQSGAVDNNPKNGGYMFEPLLVCMC